MSAPTGLEWPEAHVEQLRALWAEGKTATEIAMALGNGFTRNAVIGKVHRLKLARRRRDGVQSSIRLEALARKLQAPPRVSPGRGTPRDPKPLAMQHRIAVRKAPVDVDASELKILKSDAWKPLPDTVPLGLEQLERHQCRWPIGDGPILFCGCDRGEHHAYCDAHARLAEPMWGVRSDG